MEFVNRKTTTVTAWNTHVIKYYKMFEELRAL